MSSTNANLNSFRTPFAAASLTLLAALLSACGGGGGGGSNTTTPPPAPQSYTIGGSISGVTGSGLTLQDNGGNNLTVAAGATSFVFSAAVQSGKAYAVTVLTQPTSPSQTCTVTGGSGTVGSSNVGNVSIACVTATVKVGGTISGLSGSGLVLRDNGGDNLQVPANATTFTFATPVQVGATYAVTVLTQPSGPAEVCTVTGGSGTAGASDVSSIVVSCVPATFQVSGTVSGLTGTGLVLQDNSSDSLTVPANAASFSFATAVPVGSGYAVSVATQPLNPAQDCTVGNGSGTIGSGNVTNVTVTCVSIGRYVYVVDSSDNSGPGDVAAFSIDPSSGALAAIAAPVSVDLVPTGIAIDRTGQFAYVSNKNSSDVTLFYVGSNGALTLHRNFTTTGVGDAAVAVTPSNQYVIIGGYDGSGGAARDFSLDPVSGDLTAGPNAPLATPDPLTSVAVDPTSKFVFATTYQAPSLYAYSIDSTGSLTPLMNSPFYDARGGAVSVWPLGNASGGYVYTVDNTASKVSGFSYDSTGNLTPLADSPYVAGANPQGIAIDPIGTYVYVTNYGDGTVTSFSINAQTGSLSPVGSPVNSGNLRNLPNGPGPIDVKVDPSNQYVYVANTIDGSVSQFTVSAGMLTLKNTYNTAAGGRPAALAIY